MSEQAEFFYLNPDHEFFVPQRAPLSLEDCGWRPRAYFYCIGCGLFPIMICTFIMFLMFSVSIWEDYQYSHRGRGIQGNILSCTVGSDTIRVSYRYFVDGTPYIQQDSLYKNDCSAYPVQGEIRVSYLPNDPSKGRASDPFTYSEKQTAYVLRCEQGEGEFLVKYRYTIGETSYEGYHPTQRCSDFPRNRRLKIEYLPDAPHLSQLEGGIDFNPLFNMMLIVFVLGIFGVLGAWMGYEFIFVFLPQLYFIRRRYPTLKNEGVIWEGQILKIEGYTVQSGHSRTYEIVVTYEFLSPQWKPCLGMQRRERPDLWDNPLPPVGTPVKILYASDRNHILL